MPVVAVSLDVPVVVAALATLRLSTGAAAVATAPLTSWRTALDSDDEEDIGSQACFACSEAIDSCPN